MTDECVHPYEEVKKVSIDAILDYKNLPLGRRTAHICTNCSSVIDVDDEDDVVFTIRGNTGCDHPFEQVEDCVIKVVTTSKRVVLTEVEVTVCKRCDHTPERTEIPLA